MRCAMFGCNSDNQTKGFSGDIKFFRFPKEDKVLQLWIHHCRRQDKINTKYSRICSKHFCEEDYERNLKQELLGYSNQNSRQRQLKPAAIPSKFLPTKSSELPITSLRKQRAERKYLLTYRLNQDVLENFFGAIRSKGGLNDHPTALEFKYRLRSYILGRHEGSLSQFGNTEVDSTPDLICDTEMNLSGKYLSKLHTADDHLDMTVNDELEDLVYDGLEGLGGYISHSLKDSAPVLCDNTSSDYTWVSHLSEGGLSIPSKQFMEHLQQLENIFKKINGDSLCICKNYIQNLMNKSELIECPEQAKKNFFRSRMHFRLKELNVSLTQTIKRKSTNVSKKWKKVI